MKIEKQQVLIAVGTRPEAIKLLPLIIAVHRSERLSPVVVSSGQHSELVREVLGLAGLEPDIDLGAATPGNSLNELFASVMTRFEQYCYEQFGKPPDTNDRFSPRPRNFPAACFVHGDTTTAAAAALAAFHLRIPIAHVEAGLRTSDTLSPFPEEANRQLVSRLATFHFAPTFRNKANLVREGVPYGRIFVSGNTAIDALQWAAQQRAPYGDPALDDLETDGSTRVIVVTAHRRENWGPGLERIAAAVAALAEQYPEVRFVIPLHPNPRVQSTLRPPLEHLSNVSLIAPMKYTAFARLLQRAYLAMTDSGGIQEEAPSLHTPVIVMRETTERQEGVDRGTLKLVGTDTDKIIAAARQLMEDPNEYLLMSSRANPYGDGRASERMVAAMEYIAFDAPLPAPYGSGFERAEVLRAAGFLIDPVDFLTNPNAERPLGS
jgi:UDP-N-acetylglucosamine 2-epimerase (non-hydrolysing)